MSAAAGPPLFRPEVLETGSRGWLGSVSLAQPLPLWVLAAFATAAAAAIVGLLFFGDYARRARVGGQLVPDLGLATVIAPVAGVLAQPVPYEGQQIDAGQRLVVIATPRATTESADLSSDLLQELELRRDALTLDFEAQAALLQLQEDGYRKQLITAEREFRQIESSIAVQEERVAIAKAFLAGFRELASAEHASRLQLNQHEQTALEQVASLKALERQAIDVQRSIESIEQALQELPARRSAQAAARTRELAALDQERLQIKASGEVLVQSPVTGLIASRLIERGQTVEAGQPLLSLLPAGSELQAQLLVPSRAAGFVEPGVAVELRYQAYPHEKFGHHRGTVLQISRHALNARELGALAGNTAPAEPYYRVLVELPAQSVTAYGREEALLPGMLLEADILGERRKLYEWLLEPLYSLSGRL